MDITPPQLTTPILHYDVSFSTSTPTAFQSSNDTIAARWSFQDLESSVAEYSWAIGTPPYADNVQPFTSVGMNTQATNTDLLGLLIHNATYYVSVTAVNGAGLSATASSTGVLYLSTALNETVLSEVVIVYSVTSVSVSSDGGSAEEVMVVEEEDRAGVRWEGVTEDVEDICE